MELLGETAVGRRFSLFNNRSQLNGPRFTATDTDWSHGDGPEVAGPALVIADATCGRAASLDVGGAGADQLRTRLAR